MRFDHPSGGEHIWLDSVHFSNGNIIGIVSNNPVTVKSVKLGDAVTIDTSKLSDWMFMRDGKAQGAFTVRLFRTRMSDVERDRFDQETQGAFQ